MPEDSSDLVQIVSPTPKLLELVQQAAKNVSAEAAEAHTKPLTKLPWLESSDEVTKEYFRDHYHKIPSNSLVTKIIDPSNIDKYYKPEVFVFLEGVSRLSSDHAGVAICLSCDRHLKTKAEDSKGRSVEVEWKQGSIIYLAGDTTFRASGEGRIVCIFLGFGKKG